MAMRRIFATTARSATKFGRVPLPARSLSSLSKKEQGDELNYIRAQEKSRADALRAEVDAILALEDGSKEKEELIDMIEEKKAPKSMLSKVGLDDWKFALPAGLFVGIPAISNEWLLVDAELQIASAFVLFVATCYTQLGPMINKSFEDKATEIYSDMTKLDDLILDKIKYSIKNGEQALALEEDFKSIYAVTDEIATAQAEVATQMEAHKLRDAVVKKLESLATLEEAASSAIRARMVNSVKSDVISAFTNDKKVKDDAMAAALGVLAGGKNAKMGKDVVGGVFASALKNYKDSYAKSDPSKDEILVQLEKDVAAIAVAPVADSKGGNMWASVGV